MIFEYDKQRPSPIFVGEENFISSFEDANETSYSSKIELKIHTS